MKRILVALAVVALSATGFGKGVLVLSFDDGEWNFDGWLKAIPVFEKYDATATFFISGPIDKRAIRVMKELQAHGHTVGLHGFSHANAVELAKKFGMEGFWTREIAPQLKACERAGIAIRDFSYPDTRHTPELDAFFFSKGFVRVRGATEYPAGGAAQCDDCFFPAKACGETRVMAGIVACRADDVTLEDLLACVRRAAKRDEAFQAIAHDIAPKASRIGMDVAWLEALLKTAKENQVSVVSYGKLGNVQKEELKK